MSKGKKRVSFIGRSVATGLVALIAAFLAFSPAAQAEKIVDSVFAGPQASSASGTAENQFNSPGDLAINDPAIDDPGTDPQANPTEGYVYVVDRLNHRIQVFNSSGQFRFMFGRGVLTGGDGAERCDLTQIPCGDPTPEAFDAEGDAVATEAGEFAFPQSVDVDQDTGDVYVRDTENFRVQKFAADGTFLRAWGWGVANGANEFQICVAPADLPCRRGSPGTGVGQFGNAEGRTSTVQGLAVSPLDAHVFVVDPGASARILEFLPDGTFVRAVGSLGAQPAAPGKFGQNTPTHLAIDANGILYASDTNGVAKAGGGFSGNRVQRYDTNDGVEAFLVPIDVTQLALDANLEQVLVSDRTGALAVAPDTGHLLVGRVFPGNSYTIEIATPGATPSFYDAHFGGLGGAFGSIDGLEVDPATGDFLASKSDSAIGHRVFRADDDGSPPAMVTIDPPVAGIHTATVEGTIDPAGALPLNYRVEYSRDGLTWSSAAALAPPADLPAGAAPVPFEAQLTGLEANSLYRVRVVTRKSFGNPEVFSDETQLTTAKSPPEVDTLFPQSRRATSATLAATVNANNLPTSYHFEYGTTSSYGSQAPVPDAVISNGVVTTVFAEVSGLQPDTTYHVRIVADNGEEISPGVTEVVGDDVTFSTRAASSAAPERAYELVSPPFKITRQVASSGERPGFNANPGVPSVDGNKLVWKLFVLPLLDETEVPFDGDRLISRRTASGWVTNSLGTLAPAPIETQTQSLWNATIGGMSGDLETQVWGTNGAHGGGLTQPALLPNEGTLPNQLYTRRDGTGTKGFTGWLTNVDAQTVAFGFPVPPENDQALFNDDGSTMARWGAYRGLISTDPALDPSVNQLSGVAGGTTLYLQRNAPLGALDLVGECTGAGATATEILLRDDHGTVVGGAAAKGTVQTTAGSAQVSVSNMTQGAAFSVGQVIVAEQAGLQFPPGTTIVAVQGTSVPGTTLTLSAPAAGTTFNFLGAQPNPAALNDDTIGAQPCATGTLVSRKGAEAGGGAASDAKVTALSQDGSRLFFTSPTAGPATCAQSGGSATDCPPQLYLRQYDGDGEPVVRWISRPEVDDQQIGLVGSGAGFEGASEDGRYVYFKTDAPLSPDDPNGTGSAPVVSGNASASSWDLYRYELPGDRDTDPDGGALLRVSGGPAGGGDANTNPSVGGAGGAARYISDDGRRAYFVTGNPIAGADSAPPSGGTTDPGTGAAGRNLYLFDDTGASPEWSFIARLPYGADSSTIATCATHAQTPGQVHAGSGATIRLGGASCVRGTPDGSAITFMTNARLTADDSDDAVDIYLYDAPRDDLTRVTGAGDTDGVPFDCQNDNFGNVNQTCNGIFGIAPGLSTNPGWGGLRHYNIAREPDGSTAVYFDSRSQLLPDDTNGDHWDVYQWREGELSLLSPADSEDHSWFSGNTANGRDVFLFTSARIDPRELDDHDYDLYDYRVGGGFPYTAPPPPCDVLAFACEREAAPAPPVQHPATPGVAGEGNPSFRKPARNCAKNKVRRGKRCVPKRASARKRCQRRGSGGKRRCVRPQLTALTKGQGDGRKARRVELRTRGTR